MKKIEGSAPPTDLELMLYLDGELEDEARRVAVRAFLDRDRAATGKARGLLSVSALVAEGARRSTGGDGIADAVMAAIAKDASKPAAHAPSKQPKPAPKLDKVPGAPVAPQNDNSKRIFALAAIALAAAAAFAFWGKGADDGPTAGLKPVPVDTTPAIITPPPSAPPAPDTPQAASHGVEVASVDFGESNGTIIYASDEATTVVWVQGSAAGGL